MNLNMFEGATLSAARPRRQEVVPTQHTPEVRSVVVTEEGRNVASNQQSGGGKEDFSIVLPMDEELFQAAKRLREQIRLVRKPTETSMGEKPLADVAVVFNDDEVLRSIPEDKQRELYAAARKLQNTVHLRRKSRDGVSENNSAEGFIGLRQSKEVPLIPERDSNERQPSASESLVSQNIPLSAQALRFEIQTREAQLRTIADQSERGRIQSQLNAYRGLLRESEQETVATRQVSASVHGRTPRITPSSIWNRVKKWFPW